MWLEIDMWKLIHFPITRRFIQSSSLKKKINHNASCLINLWLRFLYLDMAGIFICLKPQVCNHYCIILFSVKWIIFWRYTLSATVLWNATSGGQPLVIRSHGVTVDTSTVPAHFSPASSPPQSLESCVQLPMSCLCGHTDVLLWGSEPSLGLHLDLVAPRAYRILSLFPQAHKKLSVWLRGELFLPLFLSVNFFPLLTSSIGPPNPPLGRAGTTGWWMRNSPLDTLKIVDF